MQATGVGVGMHRRGLGERAAVDYLDAQLTIVDAAHQPGQLRGVAAHEHPLRTDLAPRIFRTEDHGPDMEAAVDERIAKIENLVRTQGAEIAQQGSRIADAKADAKAADGKPLDDLPLRRVVASALLEVLVRVGDPFPAALAAGCLLTVLLYSAMTAVGPRFGLKL